jgi:hypothetical protein
MPRGKTQRTRDLLEACYTILQEIQPASVRAVCYQLFIRQHLRSMAKNETNRVSSQLVYARETGIIPWAWIVDETRHAEDHGGWDDPEQLLRAAVASYRRDRWGLQPVRVEVWSEKGTVRGTLQPVLHDLGLVFRVMHGYASATAVHEVVLKAQDDPRPLIVLYVGDWDPSGLHMSAVDLPKRLGDYGAPLPITRLAITEAEARATGLPSFDARTKQTDARYRWFVERHGTTCWEVDAMSPVTLRETVQFAVEQCIDWDAWQRCAQTEQAERRSLQQVFGTWKAVKSGQATE